MATRPVQVKCKVCGKTAGTSPAANHLLHLVVTCISFGLWLPVWFLAAYFPGAARCNQCGGIAKEVRRSFKLN